MELQDLQLGDGYIQIAYNPTDTENVKMVVQNRSPVYVSKADNIIAGDRLHEMENPFINEVMCLDVTLERNICCKNKITEILKDNKYSISVFPAYYIRGMVVELLENGKYFKVLPNKN